MKFSFLFYLIVSSPFAVLPVHAMEQRTVSSPADLRAAVSQNLKQNERYHELIPRMVDTFYDIRKRIIVLIASIETLDKQRAIDIKYDQIRKRLENAKLRVDSIFDQARTIAIQEEELKHSSTDVSAIFQQEALFNRELEKLSDQCFARVANAKLFYDGLCKNPKIQQVYQVLQNLSRQTYFETLSWITHDSAGKSDIVAFLIGARGYAHQEIPAFLKKIARENPQAQIVIYSFGSDIDCEPIADVNLQGLNGMSRFSDAQQINVVNFHIPENLNQLMTNDTRELSPEQQETFLQQPIIYSSHELPNIKLVSCYLQLPLLKSNTGSAFFKQAFLNYIDRKLNEGSIVFIGNHTQCYNFEGIPLIAQLYYHFKHEIRHANICNLQLYTQCADGQCIVYDPLELAEQHIMKFNDHAGKLFLPETRLGVCCATLPCSQFISENGLQYHITNCSENGLMVTHVSGNGWEQPEILTIEREYSRDPHHPEAPQPCY